MEIRTIQGGLAVPIVVLEAFLALMNREGEENEGKEEKEGEVHLPVGEGMIVGPRRVRIMTIGISITSIENEIGEVLATWGGLPKEAAYHPPMIEVHIKRVETEI